MRRSSGLELVVFAFLYLQRRKDIALSNNFYKLYWKWYFKMSPFAKRIQGGVSVYITCVLFLLVLVLEALLPTFDKLLASWKSEFLIHLPCLGQGWLIPGIDSCRSNSIILMREVAGLQRLSLLLH
ncbi:hypothetical protein ACJX0J_004470 (mitochondrion) [Zea mays]